MGHSSSADLSRPFVNSTNSFPAATHSLHLRRLFLRLHCLPLKDALGSSRRHAPQIFITSWHLSRKECPVAPWRTIADASTQRHPKQVCVNDDKEAMPSTRPARPSPTRLLPLLSLWPGRPCCASATAAPLRQCQIFEKRSAVTRHPKPVDGCGRWTRARSSSGARQT